MEYIDVIVTALVSLISALGGGSIIYFHQTKRLKAAEAALAESKVENDEVARWRDLFDKKNEELKKTEEKLGADLERARAYIEDRRAKIGEMYTEIDDLKNEKHVLISKYNSLMLVVGSVKMNYCNRPNCPDRIPPKEMTVEDLEKELVKRGLILPVDTTTLPEG